MSQFSLDYDYPINEKKAVLNIKPNLFWYKKDQVSCSSSMSSLNNIFSPENSSNRKNQDKVFDSQNEYIYNKDIQTNTKNDVNILNSVIPLPEKNHPSKGVYYDIPKNIPVNTRFFKESFSTLPCSSPKTSKYTNEGCDEKMKPEIPRKSSFVKNKISNYKNTNNPNYQNLMIQNNTIDSLNKYETSKLSPLLPNAIKIKESCFKKTIPNESCCQNISDIFDDDEECDYDYDYVCLESKKKLDDDDQKIKLFLSRESQFRYQNLIFRSNNFDKLFSTRNTKSSNSNIMVHHYYRNTIFQAQKNFQHWTKFTVEIIQHQYKPEVYFNFIKHILLSGQNLLTIFKLASRYICNDKKVEEFSEKFLDILKQIVSTTKRASSTAISDQIEPFQELIECIHKASQIAQKVETIVF